MRRTPSKAAVMRKAAALETLKKTLAAPQSNPDDERGVGGDESVSEAVSKNIFASYKPSCSAVDRGIVHPGDDDTVFRGLLNSESPFALSTQLGPCVNIRQRLQHLSV